MRFSRTLSRYLARETLQYAAVGFIAIASLLLANSLLRQLEDLISLGGDLGEVLAVTVRLVAILAAYALPIALLFGTLVAFGRLGADHEVLAFRSLGVSLAQLAAPALALAVLVSAATGWLLQRGEPEARQAVLGLVESIAARGGVIRGGTFTRLDRQGERMLFIDKRKRNGTLLRVLISDRSDPKRGFVVLAAHGSFQFDRETGTGHLILCQTYPEIANAPVVVVGGGIAGLTMALSLHQAGIGQPECSVADRERVVRLWTRFKNPADGRMRFVDLIIHRAAAA
jgi:lipopolysaccharide export system permease protein